MNYIFSKYKLFYMLSDRTLSAIVMHEGKYDRLANKSLYLSITTVKVSRHRTLQPVVRIIKSLLTIDPH